MIGYKIVNSNYEEKLNNHITKFEIGKTYHREKIGTKLPSLVPFNDDGSKMELNPITINNYAPFYFYKDLLSLFKNHDCYPDMRILEIISEKSEEVLGLAYQSTDITIMREISREQIIEHIYALDLPHSDNSKLREVSAMYSCSLEDLIADEDEFVRAAVAETGFGSNILVRDDHALVRSSVALSNNKLDILITDPSAMVRVCVANKGYKPERLIYDDDYMVRKIVAKHGYGVDRLINDRCKAVRDAAENYITYFM